MKNNLMKFPPVEKIQKVKKQTKSKPISWISNLLKQNKEKQDELTQKKIDFLVKQAYEYYLTLIINDIIESNETDIHPDLYRIGIVISQQAINCAEEAVINVVKQGSKRINECYTNRLKELKSAGIKPAQNIFVH